MYLRIEQYVAILLLLSFGAFFLLASWMGGTNEPYRDLLLTFAVVHFIMWKLITIKQNEEKKEK
ncbi:hypothetical protein E1I69_23510 [Bacillus timonensis]|uniref:Uncharacterized protein n=1 Tax=Bacillus timonensis TaxID=1033734 RepID=A0A4S3PIE4_9BACI|nr:hypothetical protein [Bacillus timonensis]THE09147.1 hypothetical protein E1I69_23510 [Bacillus timonensis]